MNNTTETNSTTLTTTTIVETTTQEETTTVEITATTATAGTPLQWDVIVGSVVGLGVIIIIILVIVCCRRYRRSKNKPPILPDPFLRIVTENWPLESSTNNTSTVDLRQRNEIAADNPCSESENSKYDSGNYMKPTPLKWIVKDPVIHSPTEPEPDERVSYILMVVPSHRMSISPPTVDLLHDPQAQERRPPPPSPCKSTVGYINVSKENPLLPLKANIQSIPLLNYENTTKDEDQFPKDKDNNEDYENFHSLSDKSFHSQNCLQETGNVPASFEGLDNIYLSGSGLKERKQSLYENMSVMDNGDSHHDSDLSGDSFMTVSSNNTQNSDSYVDVRGYKKTPPVKQLTFTAIEESPSLTEPEIHDQASSYVNVERYKRIVPVKQFTDNDVQESSNITEKGRQHPTSESKPQVKPKPPGILPKPKLGQQISVDAKVNLKSNSNCSEDQKMKTGQKPTDFQVPVTKNHDLRHVNIEDVKNVPVEKKSKHPNSKKLAVADLTDDKNKKTRNENTDDSSVMKSCSSSNTSDDEDHLYQNSEQLSLSERKLSNTSNNQSVMTSVERKISNIQRNATDIQQNLNGSVDKTRTTATTKSNNVSDISRPQMQNVTFGSSSDVAISGNILQELKSKLKKAN